MWRLITETAKRVGVTALIAIPAVGALAGVVAPAASAAKGTYVQQSSDAKAILEYWTPERRAAAKEVSVLPLQTTATPQAITNVQAPEGKSGFADAAPPGGASVTAPAGLSGPENSFSWPGPYPYPHTAFPVPAARYRDWPFSVNGKIFFTNDGEATFAPVR